MGAARNWMINVVGIDSMSPRWGGMGPWFAMRMERIAHDNSFADADAVFAAIDELARYVNDATAAAARRILTIVAEDRAGAVGAAAFGPEQDMLDSPSPRLQRLLQLWSGLAQMMCDLQPAVARARRIERAQTRAMACAAEQQAIHGDDAHLRAEHGPSAVIESTDIVPHVAGRVERTSLSKRHASPSAHVGRPFHPNASSIFRKNLNCRRQGRGRGRLQCRGDRITSGGDLSLQFHLRPWRSATAD